MQLSARTAQHDATEANFLGDVGRPRADNGGALEETLETTSKWSRAPAHISNPDLINFSRSGVRHIKSARRLKRVSGPREVTLKETIGSPQHQDASAPLVLPGTHGRRRSRGISNPCIEQIPEIARRLIAGDGVPDMISAAVQLLRMVQGENDSAVAVRIAVGNYAGILLSLIKLIKLCQPPHHVHKPMVMKTLSQLVFYNQANAEILTAEEGLLAQLHSALFSGLDVLQMESARLINNLIASSVNSAEKLCNYTGMLDAIKRLFSNPNFLIRFRAVSTVNCLTRHALSNLKMGATLAEANIVKELQAVGSKEAGNAEQLRLYEFMVTCSIGNAMGTVERRTWAAKEQHLETAVKVFRTARVGGKYATVTCHIHSVLLSIRYLAVSDANKKALTNYGLVDELADFLETWEEDSSKDLAVQLACLELAMALLLKMLTVDGHTVIKIKLFSTEIKARLQELNFGACLFRSETLPYDSGLNMS